MRNWHAARDHRRRRGRTGGQQRLDGRTHRHLEECRPPPRPARDARAAVIDAIAQSRSQRRGRRTRPSRLSGTSNGSSSLRPIPLPGRDPNCCSIPARAMPRVVARVGVDLDPVDVTDADDARWLRACTASTKRRPAGRWRGCRRRGRSRPGDTDTWRSPRLWPQHHRPGGVRRVGPARRGHWPMLVAGPLAGVAGRLLVSGQVDPLANFPEIGISSSGAGSEEARTSTEGAGDGTCRPAVATVTATGSHADVRVGRRCASRGPAGE